MAIVYCISVVIDIYILLAAAFTDPGIIPRIEKRFADGRKNVEHDEPNQESKSDEGEHELKSINAEKQSDEET